MSATDPVKQLVRELTSLQREVRSQSRASQAAWRSVEVNGETFALPQVVRDGQTALTAAEEAAANATTALTAANGKNAVVYSPDPPTDDTPGTRPGDIWFQRDADGVIVGSWEWTGSAPWEPRTFGDAVLDSLTVGKLVTGSIAAGQRIIAGPESGVHAEMTSTGFRVFGDDRDLDGSPDEVVRLGTDTDDVFALVAADGSLAASIDQTGRASVSGIVSRTWPEVTAPDWTGKGGSLDALLDRRPRGLVSWGGQYVDAPSSSNSTAGVGVYEIAATVHPGRMYKVHTSPLRMSGSAIGDLAEVQIRATSAPMGTAVATPSISTPVLARAHVHIGRTEANATQITKLVGPPTEETGPLDMRLLLAYSRAAGTGNVLMNGASPEVIEMWVEDIGPWMPNRQIASTGGGGTTTAPPREQIIQVSAAWVQSYRSTGVVSDNTYAYQGYGDPTNGMQRSFIGFPDLTGTLAGATITEASVRLNAEHWWYNDGGIAVVGRHGYLSPPGSLGASRAENDTQSPPNGGSTYFPKPGARWVTLPTDLDGWRTGTNRGVMLGSAGMGTDRRYYGRFSGGGEAILSIRYVK